MRRYGCIDIQWATHSWELHWGWVKTLACEMIAGCKNMLDAGKCRSVKHRRKKHSTPGNRLLEDVVRFPFKIIVQEVSTIQERAIRFVYGHQSVITPNDPSI